ncbi:MAG: hypothetical protein RL637_247 [Pseudomonadota bacterium]|jgi:hypothetical protein
MYAEKLILETDEHGFFKQKLNLPPNSTVEAIFLVLKEPKKVKRKSSIKVTEKVTCSPLLDKANSDWNKAEDMIGWLLEHPLEIIDGDAKPLTREEIYASRKD